MSREAALDRIRRLGPRRVLDVATGRGGCIGWLLEALEDIEQVAGIDVSTDTLCDTARTYPHESVDLIGMCATRLGFRSGIFDLVTIVNSVHHLCSPPQALAEMVRVLRPGGLLLVCEMTSDSQSEKQQSHVLLHHWWAEIDRLAGISHDETFTRHEMLSLIAGLGLDGVEVFEDGGNQGQEVDEDTIRFLKDTIDGYTGKIAGNPEYERLRNRGRELRRRIEEVGFAWARGLTIIGEKPRR
ncbi:methyltransferase domain-containing protein [Candidatus Fermentibacterales bacterium]|nr:methyltransferase domain-containing protein [Candidatus Fermentibacterales bacterium]